jgi:O-antigen ligase
MIGMDFNSLSIMLIAGAGLAFFFGLYADRFWIRWGSLACAALIAHVPMFGMSRGGMLGLIVVGVVSFVLIPKQPKHYAFFALAVVVGLMLAGPSVREEFATVFLDEAERDASAQGRVEMWGICLEEMFANPVVGIGQEHWGIVVAQHGWPKGKEAHSLWFQSAAELGIPGILWLIGFYFTTLWLMWGLIRHRDAFDDPWFPFAGRMVIASLVGFMAAASFVTVEGLEIPFYVALLGAASVNLAPMHATLPVHAQCEELGDLDYTDVQLHRAWT